MRFTNPDTKYNLFYNITSAAVGVLKIRDLPNTIRENTNFTVVNNMRTRSIFKRMVYNVNNQFVLILNGLSLAVALPSHKFKWALAMIMACVELPCASYFMCREVG